MFVVTVHFIVAPEHRDVFAAAMFEQAEQSLEFEPDCHVFEVCVGADNNCSFFLYEKYTDAAAFDAHLETRHFVSFNEAVTPWVESKTVDTWVEQTL
ncbi:MAG: antibiotic biosynthesis monooxygenase [Pseudomonadota bacterium]